MSANAREVTPSRRSAEGTADISHATPVEHYNVRPKGSSDGVGGGESSSEARHGAVELVDSSSNNNNDRDDHSTNAVAAFEATKPGRFAFLRTKQFYLVLLLSQALAVAITGTNTLSSLLADEGTSIPALQTLFNYILLTLIYTTYTIYKYGFKGWAKLLWKDGWRYFILSFCDVQGNYFTVLAYRYTNILSAQLINFWAIAVVVLISLIFLKVRYHIAQYAGILICCGGLGVLVASDHITGGSGETVDAVKGDLFALLGASFYGFTNVFEEFLVSKRPLYEVLGQLSFWAIPINGVQAAIFDRSSIRNATWNPAVGGYLTGYTLILTIFYSGAPIVFRMASAAFFNIGLLTGNFWGVVIGVKVFGLSIHWMYPIAFVLIVVGLFVYFTTESVLGEARKPWLGENQEGGSDGIGTAKRRVENPGVLV